MGDMHKLMVDMHKLEGDVDKLMCEGGGGEAGESHHRVMILTQRSRGGLESGLLGASKVQFRRQSS